MDSQEYSDTVTIFSTRSKAHLRHSLCELVNQCIPDMSSLRELPDGQDYCTIVTLPATVKHESQRNAFLLDFTITACS